MLYVRLFLAYMVDENILNISWNLMLYVRLFLVYMVDENILNITYLKSYVVCEAVLSVYGWWKHS